MNADERPTQTVQYTEQEVWVALCLNQKHACFAVVLILSKAIQRGASKWPRILAATGHLGQV